MSSQVAPRLWVEGRVATQSHQLVCVKIFLFLSILFLFLKTLLEWLNLDNADDVVFLSIVCVVDSLWALELGTGQVTCPFLVLHLKQVCHCHSSFLSVSPTDFFTHVVYSH